MKKRTTKLSHSTDVHAIFNGTPDEVAQLRLPKTRTPSAQTVQKTAIRTEWQEKFLEKIKSCHKRNLNKVVNKILKRADSTKIALVTRSKKHGVECNITVEELRELLYKMYGTKCKYCDKILNINTLVFDHIIPISKGGSSNIDNIQIICKTSNGMKGSLSEENFQIVLDWLETVPEEIKKDISVRLARGVI
jgi:5-methylcytosine-specific restriction endonuclease McrA